MQRVEQNCSSSKFLSVKFLSFFKWQIVCYDPNKEKPLKGYQDLREPVKLVNFSKRKSGESRLEEDILSKRSHIKSVSNNDIVFEYDESSSQEAEQTYKTIGTIM